jgi:mono/diheme cytochrome c family protein
MSRKRLLPATIIASVMLAGHGQAQEFGQPGRGLELAQRLCTECHAVGKDDARSPNERAPRFQTIAAVPGMTATALSAALNTSHRTMPNIILQPEEQAHIIAYILSLK